jgi:hypothetical protein
MIDVLSEYPLFELEYGCFLYPVAIYPCSRAESHIRGDAEEKGSRTDVDI